VIDAHQHFWQIGEHGCIWPPPELIPVYRHFVPADLEPLAQAAGITGTVLVQSQESDADTDYLLCLADKSSLVNAVVGWVDLASPDAAIRINGLAKHPKLRGLRPMLQSMPDDNWILRSQLEPAIAAMKVAQLSLDALVGVRHLPGLQVFAERHPDLPIVIDHAAKPHIAGGEFQSWVTALSTLAVLPHVYCKLSGLVTEAAEHQGVEDLRPYVEQLYRLFGARRLMWASDWPVLNLAPNKGYASYGKWLALAKHLLSGLSARESEAVFEKTARDFYRF